MSALLGFPDLRPREAEETVADRRVNDWQTPRFWVSVLSLMLVIGLALLTAIWRQLDNIGTKVDGIALANNTNATKIADFERRIAELERAKGQHETDFRDYMTMINGKVSEIKGFNEGKAASGKK